jgi:carbonic anhydrase/acetyltransferase-like protein (isoleucine patch superfamily)
MHALVLTSASPNASRDLARPIAGAPLLARQLEFLRGNGVTHVVINRVADEPAPISLRDDALNVGLSITWIPSTQPLDRYELARRAGLDGQLLVVLAHGRMSNVDLGKAIALASMSANDVEVGEASRAIAIWHAGREFREVRSVVADGWIADIVTEEYAQALTEDALLGRCSGIEIRGSEVAPGVWMGRGAIVSRSANVEAPCYFGPNAFVGQGAHVGPGAVLGASAVVETGARVTHARVDDKVVVGRSLIVDRAYLSAKVLTPHVGEAIQMDDELLVSARRASTIPARLAAVAALGVVAPAALAFGGDALVIARRLARIVSGTGSWIGVSDEEAVLDVEQVLVHRDAGEEDRAAARALYRSTKSSSSDARLLLSRIIRGGSTQ